MTTATLEQVYSGKVKALAGKILRRAYRQYRSMGLSPAVSIEYGRNQVEFHHNGW